jgi:MGT family glycosyltransferase
MRKGLFFSLPSVSISKTITTIVDRLPKDQFDIVYYNREGYQSKVANGLRFKAYPDYEKGYDTDRIDAGTSYFQFAETLVDTTISLLDFLCEEVEREKPDFILHSQLATWGKWIARRYGLPAVGLFITFVMDERIMLPYFRKMRSSMGAASGDINDVLGLHKKLQGLYKRLDLEGRPDIWDVYVNREALNLSSILPAFQPEPQLLDGRYKFVGFPTTVEAGRKEKELIYVSMGTVLNKDLSIYVLIIDVLKELGVESVVAMGRDIDLLQFGPLPSFIHVMGFIDQEAMLKETTLFITRGGMSSIQQAMYKHTPVVVIPEIPEQQMTAATVEKLGVGIHIPAHQVSGPVLRDAILRIRDNYQQYLGCVKTLCETVPDHAPHELAAAYIEEYLHNCEAPGEQNRIGDSNK